MNEINSIGAAFVAAGIEETTTSKQNTPVTVVIKRPGPLSMMEGREKIAEPFWIWLAGAGPQKTSSAVLDRNNHKLCFAPSTAVRCASCGKEGHLAAWRVSKGQAVCDCGSKTVTKVMVERPSLPDLGRKAEGLHLTAVLPELLGVVDSRCKAAVAAYKEKRPELGPLAQAVQAHEAYADRMVVPQNWMNNADEAVQFCASPSIVAGQSSLEDLAQMGLIHREVAHHAQRPPPRAKPVNIDLDAI